MAGSSTSVEAQRAELRQHDEQAARRARRHGRERAVLGRTVHAARAKELRRRARRRDAERVDRAHLAAARVEDQRLGLAAPGQRVPHRRGGGEHGAGRVDGVAAARERQGAGGGRQRLARDSDPMLAVQRGLMRLALFLAARGAGGEDGRGGRNDDGAAPEGADRDHGPSLAPVPGQQPGKRHAATQPVECARDAQKRARRARAVPRRRPGR